MTQLSLVILVHWTLRMEVLSRQPASFPHGPHGFWLQAGDALSNAGAVFKCGRKARVSAQHAAVCFLLIAGQEDQEQCQARLLSSGMKSRWYNNGKAGFSRTSLKMLRHCEIQG